jgi:branched-chain amino acid transport system ATP-binding protein
MANIYVAGRPRDISAIWRRVGVRGVSKSVGRRSVLCNLNFFIEDGEILGLVGPHGSTVLDLLSGETLPTFGRITVNGSDVTQLGSDRRRSMGIVRVLRPTELFMEMTALENVALGTSGRAPFYPRQGGMTQRDADLTTLDSVGLAGRGEAPVAVLSAYERCLLALAIALAAKPSLLLLDGSPEGLTRVEQLRFGALIADIRDERGTSVLIAERFMPSPLHFLDRILVLRRGRIVADDVPSKLVAEHFDRGHGAAVGALSAASDPLRF